MMVILHYYNYCYLHLLDLYAQAIQFSYRQVLCTYILFAFIIPYAFGQIWNI